MTSERNIKEFKLMDLQDLFDEIITLEGGDLWDGMSSKINEVNRKNARQAFGEKMRELGVKWD